MYVKISNGAVEQFPYTLGDLRRDNRNTSFPRKIPDQTLAAYGVYKVVEAAAPSYDERTQKIERSQAPLMTDGVWSISWAVIDKSQDEVQQYNAAAAKAVRDKRDGLLAETDWVVIMHTEKGTNIPADIEIYRQALRDITSHANFPHLTDTDWPVKP